MALWWCALFGDVIKLPVLITSWDTGVPPVRLRFVFGVGRCQNKNQDKQNYTQR